MKGVSAAVYFPFGFEGRIWDLIVSVPDHCLSFYSVSIARRILKILLQIHTLDINHAYADRILAI